MREHDDPVISQIEEALTSLEAIVCEITNFSHKHSRGDNSHYAITLVSSWFIDVRQIDRQRLVNRQLMPLLHNPVHAWTLSLYSPEEWNANPQERDIPSCQSSADER